MGLHLINENKGCGNLQDEDLISVNNSQKDCSKTGCRFEILGYYYNIIWQMQEGDEE